jgi:hypothetical protein
MRAKQPKRKKAYEWTSELRTGSGTKDLGAIPGTRPVENEQGLCREPLDTERRAMRAYRVPSLDVAVRANEKPHRFWRGSVRTLRRFDISVLNNFGNCHLTTIVFGIPFVRPH